MQDSNDYNPQATPISGPYAGLDPDQLPVIVDPQGQPVKATDSAQDEDWTDSHCATLVNALAALCASHTVQIESGADKPLHRIVLGDSFAPQSLAHALSGALNHHATK